MTFRIGGLFVVVTLLLAISANYVFHRWISARLELGKRGRRALAIALGATIAAPLVARLLLFFGAPDRLTWIEGVGQLWSLSLLVAMPGLLLIELLRARAARRAEKRGAEADEPPRQPGEPHDPARRDVLATLGGSAVIGASVLPLAWGAVRTRFDVELTEIPIRIARLPKVLDGFTIVQVSDIHIGAYLGEPELRRGEELVRAARPDLLVMTGDLVHLRKPYLPEAMQWLKRLHALARHGSRSILGNHEYYVGRSAVLDAFHSAGLDLLLNESRTIAPSDGGGFSLVGVDDYSGAGSSRGTGPRADRALEGVDPEHARILLCHQPQFHRVAAGLGFDLQLSGHTHGGQVAPFGPVVCRAIYGPSAGLYEQGPFRLYVNRGFGTSGPPSRVAVRPEITKIVLVSG